MSVPLDRLYNFLSNVCNRSDLLIYRFLPHGSRKLQDLQWLEGKPYDWFEFQTAHNLIFHDQELLLYDFYSENDILAEVQKRRYWRSESDTVLGDYAVEWHKIITQMHLRSRIKFPISVHDQVLLCHSEKNSGELTRYEQNDFIGVYYWSHALIARDWFRYAKLDATLTVKFDQITKDFLIYNRAWSGIREYRLRFIELLLNQNLHDVCKVSFNPVDTDTHYTNHKFANHQFRLNRADIENYIPTTHVDASASADYDSQDYAQCAIEVVLETLFDDQRQHLTEKALRPIACGRPFIIVSTPGCLQYLRDYGFETFDGLIDESYDTIQDPDERLYAITAEMKRISMLAPDQKRKLWQDLYEISAKNRQLFFSDQWHDKIVSEFKNNFDSAIARVTCTNKSWNKIKKLVPDYHDNLLCNEDDLKKFNTWLAAKQS